MGEILDTVQYKYEDESQWGDLLTKYDDVAISYDDIGNPLSDGTWTYTWEHGRELTAMGNGSTTWTYTYDANGMRTSRSNGTTTYKYVYNGGSLVQMTVGSNTLYFTSDTVTLNGITYYYVKNLQGDIVAILNSSGTAVVQYTYDAWGKPLSITGSMASTLGTLNPLLYRGYVFDAESGLYYLQSRYYDPEVGRFINADGLVTTGQGLLGNNMFVYCGNNPVSRIDSTGNNFRCAFSVIGVDGGNEVEIDYIIYYYHPESSANLDGPAKRNHSSSESIFVAVSSFDELVYAINNTPSCINDVFIYVHGDENNLCFYDAQYFSAKDIANRFGEIDINGNIYLFSCKGGKGALASTMAEVTQCAVIASEYKVSFDENAARCSWKYYAADNLVRSSYTWYTFYPDGTRQPYSYYWIYTY